MLALEPQPFGLDLGLLDLAVDQQLVIAAEEAFELTELVALGLERSVSLAQIAQLAVLIEDGHQLAVPPVELGELLVEVPDLDVEDFRLLIQKVALELLDLRLERDDLR